MMFSGMSKREKMWKFHFLTDQACCWILSRYQVLKNQHWYKNIFYTYILPLIITEMFALINTYKISENSLKNTCSGFIFTKKDPTQDFLLQNFENFQISYSTCKQRHFTALFCNLNSWVPFVSLTIPTLFHNSKGLKLHRFSCYSIAAIPLL